MEMDVDVEAFKRVNMPKNLVYDLGVPAEKTLPEFICPDPLAKVKEKIQKITLNNSRDVDAIYKDKGRLVEFDQAYDYNSCGKAPIILSYFKSISNIFDLEFFTNKLGSSANTASNVEKMVLSGVPFWEDGDDSLFADMDGDESSEEEEKKPQRRGTLKKKVDDDRFEQGGHKPLKNVLATKVAEKIATEKRDKMQLQQDLETIKDQFNDVAQIMKKQEMAGSINRAAQLLHDIHQIKYYGVLTILYQMQDKYFKDRQG